ncbi:MAG: Cell division protein FtsL [Parcubacteria group bacterium GW2011_GWC2_38_7]|nr:MAG: Cell division protein FtsL [Parcubacteria group bacterium GW2011_GWC2_38_7]
MDKGQKTKSDKSLLFKIVLVFLILLILALVVGTIREYSRQKELDKELAALQEEISKLNLDKSQFLSSIEAYQSEFFVEQEARLKFNLQKPGEKVMVIPGDGIPGLTSVGSADLVAEGFASKTAFYVNNARAWWTYFFKARENNN